MFWIFSGVLAALTVSIMAKAVMRPVMGMPAIRLSVILTGTIPIATLGLYLLLGRPDLTSWRNGPMLPPFIASAVQNLKDGLKQNPNDRDAWVLLGSIYAKVDRYKESVEAYRHALALDAKDDKLKTSLAEALVNQQGGTVKGEALDLFQQTSTTPISRYYIAFAKARSGDWQAALVDWQALVDAGPADAPWIKPTQDRIAQAKRALGLDEEKH